MVEDIAQRIKLIEEDIKRLMTEIDTKIDIKKKVNYPVAVAAEYLGIDAEQGVFTNRNYSPESIDEQINTMYNEGVKLIIKTLVKRNEKLFETFSMLMIIYKDTPVHQYQTDNPNNTSTRIATPRQIYNDLFIAFSQGMNYAIEHKGAPASKEAFEKEYARIRSQDILIV